MENTNTTNGTNELTATTIAHLNWCVNRWNEDLEPSELHRTVDDVVNVLAGADVLDLIEQIAERSEPIGPWSSYRSPVDVAIEMLVRTGAINL